ncbi:MAG: HAD-IIA family hydrolase [Clostridia bacterium]|nr:HAD-IIA family hydrolase [Clostridia bacterium]
MDKIKEIVKKTKCLVLDMDGTIYLDSTPIGDMINTLKICREKGIKIYYFTNNSSKNYMEYVKKLSKIGFYDDRDIVYTSAMATISFINSEFKDKKVYVLATDEVKKSFSEGGVNVVEEDADIVLLAYDTTLTFEKLKKANEMLVRGAIYIATHPDMVCPTADISMPDVGSFIRLLEGSSGRVPDYIIGKPNNIAGREIMRATGLNADEITMVGDRLYTDIKFGVNSGFNTILVFSGETTPDMLKQSDVVPTLTFNDLNEIVKYLD